MFDLEKMPVYDFKGEETVAEWESEIEEMIIQMICATDKRGVVIIVNAAPLIEGFRIVAKQIRDNMNNDIGDPCTLMPSCPREEF